MIDDDEGLCTALTVALEDEFAVEIAPSGSGARQFMSSRKARSAWADTHTPFGTPVVPDVNMT